MKNLKKFHYLKNEVMEINSENLSLPQKLGRLENTEFLTDYITKELKHKDGNEFLKTIIQTIIKNFQIKR